MPNPLQFVIYDRYNNVIEDISSVTLDKQVTHRLNRPATARGRLPSRLASAISCGDAALKVRKDGDIFFNGIVWFVDDAGDENTAYTEFIAVSPLIWLRYRYARDDDGDFSDPFFFRELIEAPTILDHLIDNSLQYDDVDDPLPVSGLTRLGITTSGGTFETGGTSMAGAPANFPMTIGDAIKLMTDTGEFDVVEVFVDDGDGFPDYVMSQANGYNGNYGTDLTGSVIFDFATGTRNVRAIKRTLDMSTIGNAVRMYLGPKLDIQHWVYEIDATNPDLPNALFIQALATASRDTYGKFMDLHMYDSMESESAVRHLYHGLFELEMLLRCTPRELVDIYPVNDQDLNFGLGDIVAFNAGPVLRGGFAGEMRVYEYTVSESNDGVFSIDKIVTSADQETDA